MQKPLKYILGILVVSILAGIIILRNGGGLEAKFNEKTVSRAEFAKIIVEYFNMKPLTTCNVFSDVPEGVWFNEYVCTLYEKGIVTGQSGQFQPQIAINRSEAAKMIHLVFGIQCEQCNFSNFFTDLQDGAWYTKYINELAAANFFQKELAIGSQFNSNGHVTHAAVKRWFLDPSLFKSP